MDRQGLFARAVSATAGVVLLASCGLWPGSKPPEPTATTEDTKKSEAAVPEKVVTVGGHRYSLKDAHDADVIATYPDGSPKSYRLVGQVKFPDGVNSYYNLDWDTNVLSPGAILDPCGSADLTSSAINISPDAVWDSLRGAVTFVVRETATHKFAVNGQIVESIDYGVGYHEYTITPEQMRSFLRSGANFLRVYGTQPCYECPRISCADFAGLGAFVDLTWDVPASPPSPSPEPTPASDDPDTGSPAPSPSASNLPSPEPSHSSQPSTGPSTPPPTPKPNGDLQFNGPEVEDNVISPNEDGRKDTAALKVTSNGQWILRVAGVPGVIGSGSGTETVTWQGSSLPEGRYKLVLTTGDSEDTEDFIVDVTPPVIGNIEPEKVTADVISDLPLKVENKFHFLINAQDAGAGVSAEDTKLESNVLDSELTFDHKSAESFIVIANSVGESDVSPYANFDIFDKAGNKARYSNTLSVDIKMASTTAFAQNDAGGSNSYSLMGSDTAYQGKHKFEGIFYSGAGQKFHAKIKLLFKMYWGERQVKKTFEAMMVFRHKEFPHAVGKTRKVLVTTFIEKEEEFSWDGKLDGVQALQGIYDFEPEDLNWTNHHSYRLPVCDMPCITYAEVQSKLAGAGMLLNSIPLSRVAHIFDGHILSPPNRLQNPNKDPETPESTRAENDLFSSFIPRLAVARPMGRPKGAYPVPPYYTEWFEAQLGYAKTRELLLNPQAFSVLSEVVAMGLAVLDDEDLDFRKDYGNAIVMPVVLDDDRIRWVGIYPGPGGRGVSTVFPAYEAQSAEEKKVKI